MSGGLRQKLRGLSGASQNGNAMKQTGGAEDAKPGAVATRERCPSPAVRFPLQRQLIEGAVTQPEEADTVAHMKRCPSCQKELAGLSTVGLHYVDSAQRYKTNSSEQ